jgi:hypothetical protein
VGAFTIASTGGGGGVTGFEVNNDILSTGVLHLNEATGITMTRGVMNDGVYFFNSGVLSVATGASTPATGAISLVAGANVSITEATAGAFTIASTGGGGGGVLTISGIAPNGAGDWTLDNGTGIGYTSLVPAQQGIQLTNTGVLSVKANSGGVPFTGAITIEEGSGISITETAGGIITVINTAQSAGSYTYTSNVPYEITDPGGYFTQPVPPVEVTYTICDKTNYTFFPATFGFSNTFTPVGAPTAVAVGDVFLSSNQTHYFSCPNAWGAGNLLINKYVYSPASQDTITLPNTVGATAFTTIYGLTSNDTSVYILALQAGTGNVMMVAHNFTTSTTAEISILVYDPFQTFNFTLNNFTASNQDYVISIGSNVTYTPIATPTQVVIALAQLITDLGVTPLIIIFSPTYDNTDNSHTICCCQSNITGISDAWVFYFNVGNNVSSIEQYVNTIYVSTTDQDVGFSYVMNNPITSTSPKLAIGTNINVSNGISQQIVVLQVIVGDYIDQYIYGLDNTARYSLWGPFNVQPPPIPTGNIYLSSSSSDDEFLYQQSAGLSLEVYNAIPSSTMVSLSFDIPCSQLVVSSGLLHFPVGALVSNGGTLTMLPASASITSVTPSGTATITVQIYCSMSISIGEFIEIVSSQFSILPPPPP